MSLEDDKYTSTFNALRHPIRRKILKILGKHPRTYTEILDELRIDKGLLNYHLENLEGLIGKNRDDKYVLTRSGWAAIDLDKGFEERFLDEKLRLLGIRLNPTLLKALVVMFLITTCMFYASYTGERGINQSLSLEILEIKDRLNEFAVKVYNLNNKLNEIYSFQNITFGSLSTSNEKDSRICSYYWVELKSSKIKPDPLSSNVTTFKIDGCYVFKIYSQFDNTTLEFNYFTISLNGYKPTFYVQKDRPYEFTDRNRELLLVSYCDLGELGCTKINLPSKGWYTITFFGRNIGGEGGLSLVNPRLDECQIKGWLRLVKSDSTLLFGFNCDRSLQSTYTSVG